MSERGLEELEEKGQKSEVIDTGIIPLPLVASVHTLIVSGGHLGALQRLCVDLAVPSFLLRAVLFS